MLTPGTGVAVGIVVVIVDFTSIFDGISVFKGLMTVTPGVGVAAGLSVKTVVFNFTFDGISVSVGLMAVIPVAVVAAGLDEAPVDFSVGALVYSLVELCVVSVVYMALVVFNARDQNIFCKQS